MRMMKRQSNRLFNLVLVLILCLSLGTAARAQTLPTGGLEITVTQVDFLKGLQALVPTAGNQFLLVNVTVKTADGKEPSDPTSLLLAVDEGGRAYAPVLFNGESSFALATEKGKKAFRVLFEIPDTAGSYQLIVLSGSEGNTVGKLDLGRSTATVQPAAATEVGAIQGEGYQAVIHGVTQSHTAGSATAPDGMKYAWLDVTLTGTGSQEPISQLAAGWSLPGQGGQAQSGLIPTRAAGLLMSLPVKMNEQMPFVRGKIVFLVKETATEIAGLQVNGTDISQALPITGDEPVSGLQQPGEDGAYHQAGWEITINSARIADKGTLANPPEGSRYLIVNLTVDNKSTQNLSVSGELSFAMTDEQGNELTQNWFADLGQSLDANLLPTQSVTGEVAFVLPNGLKPGNLRVHLSMLGEPLMIPMAGYITE